MFFPIVQCAGVAPVFTDNHKYVMSQRTAVYEDLKAALQIMHIINDKTPAANVFYAMWLLENKQLTVGFNINVSQHTIYPHQLHSEQPSNYNYNFFLIFRRLAAIS